MFSLFSIHRKKMSILICHSKLSSQVILGLTFIYDLLTDHPWNKEKINNWICSEFPSFLNIYDLNIHGVHFQYIILQSIKDQILNLILIEYIELLFFSLKGSI